jgi:membrane protease YdiL (CAAX protease family)
MPFLLALAGYGLYLLLGGSPTEGWQWSSPLLFVATVLFIFFLCGGQEEAGWRGFALPRLQARYSALLSSLILGVIWALWHLPNFFLPGTTQSELPILWFMLLVPALTVILTWILNNTRGSLLPVMLFHAAVNTSCAAAPGRPRRPRQCARRRADGSLARRHRAGRGVRPGAAHQMPEPFEARRDPSSSKLR